MGESLVEVPKVENKMGDSVTNMSYLQESVSFGRFEHDSLCWERWSTFPTNKYLEEVEKCSTPGSVAQKKAYFEAHYKRIAARKAELDEEKKREAELMNSEDQTLSVLICNTSEDEVDVERSSTQNSVDGSEVLNEVGSFTGEVSDKHIDIPNNSIDVVIEEDGVEDIASEVTEHNDELTDGVDVINEVHEVADLTGEVSEGTDDLNDEANVVDEKIDLQPGHVDDPNDGADMIKENKDILPHQEDTSEDLCLTMEVPELPDVPVLVQEESVSARVWQDKEVLPQEKIEEREIPVRETKTAVESNDLGKIKKTTLVKKTANTTNVKKIPASPIPKRPASPIPKRPASPIPKRPASPISKRPASPIPKRPASPIPKRPASPMAKSPMVSTPKSKSPMVSTPKSLKPDLAKTAKSTIRPSVKKENGYTPVTSKKATRPESKRLPTTALHMSFNLGPANSDPASLTTMRKSLIMESMGDKDIVKRAFKAFQNVNQVAPSSLGKPTTTNQPATREIELKPSTPNTLQKKERIVRAAKATRPIVSQQGTKKTSQSPGLKRNIGVDHRTGKAAPASFGSRSQNQGREQKEVPKKIEQNTNIKDAGKAHLQSTLKAEKAEEIGKPSQRINSKPKLSSSYNQGHGFLRGSVRKENAKI